MTGVLKGIVAALVADPAIAGTVGTRVVLLRGAATDTLPLVIVRPVGSGAEVRCTDGDRVVTRNVQFMCVAVSALVALQLCDDLKPVLDTQVFACAPETLISCTLVGDECPQQVGWLTDQRAVYMVVATYKLMFLGAA